VVDFIDEGTCMIIHLEPKSLFQPLSSDTLYGAICSSLSNLYENFEEMLELLEKNPPFLISSAFPFVGKEGTNHFFPKPIERSQKATNMDDELDLRKLKKIKQYRNAKYIHESIFNGWINGEVNDTYLINNIQDYKIQDGLVFPKKLDLKFSIESLDTARNSINRLSQFSDIFYSSGDQYKNAGLYFMVKFRNKEQETKYKPVVESAIKFLGDRGFGGDISSGKGHFDIGDISDKEIINQPDEGAKIISLSHYHPDISEIKTFLVKKDLWYDIYTKRGRDSTGKMRKQVRFFTEGSTFPNLNKDLYGKSMPVGDRAVEFGYAFDVIMR
jgi:CRISPR-associated protein Csm4